jgi:hypothetical protein
VNEYCRRVIRVLAAGLVALLGAGCAHRPKDPSADLRSLADALAGHDPHAVWARLSDSTRARVPAPAFGRSWTETAAERAALAAQIRRAVEQHAVHLAASVVSDSDVATLEQDPDGWKVATPRPSGRGAPSPDDALRRFLAALEAHDFDAFLRLLGEPLKSLVERELADRVAGLHAAAGKPLVIDGDHAHIQYDARHHVDLRRENGQWLVVDFN